MVLNTIIALGAGFVLLYVVATLTRLLGGGGIATLLTQSAVLGAAAYGLLTVGFVGLPVAVALGLLPLALRIFAYGWFYYIGRKVLSGDYGEQAQWAAELVEEEDEEFLRASMQLPQMEMREIGVLSDSKEELRENTVERAEELREDAS